MAETTNISWARSTFNPWIGCTKVGPGCDHCYAEELDRERFSKTVGGATKEHPIVHWGVGAPRYRTKSPWGDVPRWNRKAAAEREAGTLWNGRPGFWPVFCASLADVFDNEVPAQWRVDLWALIDATPNLEWLIVTKRVGLVAKWIELWGWPANARLLITVCSQEEADRDIPKLLALPCKNGISYEPALGPVDWSRWLAIRRSTGMSPWVPDGAMNMLQWIIVGGESTQGAGAARPFDLDWARSTMGQCKAAGVPVFVKQLGSNAQDIAYPAFDTETERNKWHAGGWTSIHEGTTTHWRKYYRLKDRAGADPAEWPQDLRVQEFPT